MTPPPLFLPEVPALALLHASRLVAVVLLVDVGDANVGPLFTTGLRTAGCVSTLNSVAHDPPPCTARWTSWFR